jgi:hypothetical protein
MTISILQNCTQDFYTEEFLLKKLHYSQKKYKNKKKDQIPPFLDLSNQDY